MLSNCAADFGGLELTWSSCVTTTPSGLRSNDRSSDHSSRADPVSKVVLQLAKPHQQLEQAICVHGRRWPLDVSEFAVVMREH